MAEACAAASAAVAGLALAEVLEVGWAVAKARAVRRVEAERALGRVRVGGSVVRGVAVVGREGAAVARVAVAAKAGCTAAVAAAGARAVASVAAWAVVAAAAAMAAGGGGGGGSGQVRGMATEEAVRAMAAVVGTAAGRAVAPSQSA